jgi:hypothetical protein
MAGAFIGLVALALLMRELRVEYVRPTKGIRTSTEMDSSQRPGFRDRRVNGSDRFTTVHLMKQRSRRAVEGDLRRMDLAHAYLILNVFPQYKSPIDPTSS